jgi:histidinol dehydrogenase
VCGQVRVDGLAGPSELLVLADDTADPATVAADLLAQAEHDPDGVPLLVTPSAALIEAVEVELAAQLATLPTADVARAALANGRATGETRGPRAERRAPVDGSARAATPETTADRR